MTVEILGPPTQGPPTDLQNGAGPPAPRRDPPAPQISPLRVAVLLLVLAGAAVGVWRLVTGSPSAAAAASRAASVYSPYVDVTLTPTYQFQLPSADPVSSVYLGFIVSDPAAACTPSWGGAYTLSQADQSLELGARVAQLQKQGGTAMISYGGEANSELAVACTNPGQLERAYLAPIQRYHVTTIDLDVEGGALANSAANTRRAVAIAAIQKQLAASHHPLRVWLTLPVSGQGLTPQGISAVRSMLAAHVSLSGVNVLAMDFGTAAAATNMFGTVRRALYASHAQVRALWSAAHLTSNAGTAWAHLGVTVMLGVNDTTAEHFTISEAGELVAFASREGIPRVSMWSLNRDSECGTAYPTTGILSNTCSGVQQSPLEFSQVLSRLRGTRTARDDVAAGTASAGASVAGADDPATSPFPIWQPSAAYVTGYKVVWQGDIYQANWWSQGTAPGSSTTNSTTAGPWLLIGPVPEGSQAYKPHLDLSSRQPAWSPTTVYHEGQRVSVDGLPFQARWYTKGNQPLDQLPGNAASPWVPLFTAPGEPRDTGIGSGTSS